MREQCDNKPQALRCFRLGLLLATAACRAERAKPSVTAGDEALPFHLASVQWSEPYHGPLGYPKGAQRATVGVDPRTGGETYYARFPAGSRFELHWHSYAEYAVVLHGKVIHTLGREQYALVPGDYVVIPPRAIHGWTADTNGDVFLLIRRDGPADFNFVAR